MYLLFEKLEAGFLFDLFFFFRKEPKSRFRERATNDKERYHLILCSW